MKRKLFNELLKSAREAVDIERETFKPSRRVVVQPVLKRRVRREKQKDLLQLKGKIQWDGDLDAMRRMRTT